MKLPVKLAAYPPPEFQWYSPGLCPLLPARPSSDQTSGWEWQHPPWQSLCQDPVGTCMEGILGTCT